MFNDKGVLRFTALVVNRYVAELNCLSFNYASNVPTSHPMGGTVEFKRFFHSPGVAAFAKNQVFANK